MAAGVVDYTGIGYEPELRPRERVRALNYPDDPDVGDSLFWIILGPSGAPTLSRPQSDFAVCYAPPFAVRRAPPGPPGPGVGYGCPERWPAWESEEDKDERERDEQEHEGAGFLFRPFAY